MADVGTNIAITGAPADSRPVTLRFKDGEQAIPGWMVAHLGGEGEVITKLADYATSVTFEQFTKEFFDEASSQELRALQGRMISNFLRRRF